MTTEEAPPTSLDTLAAADPSSVTETMPPDGRKADDVAKVATGVTEIAQGMHPVVAELASTVESHGGILEGLRADVEAIKARLGL